MTQEPILIKNVVPLSFLKDLKLRASTLKSWEFTYPTTPPDVEFELEKKFPKLDLTDNIGDNPPKDMLLGQSHALFLLIHARGGFRYFNNYFQWCGISIKDKYWEGSLHTDEQNTNRLKVIGVLNPDWDPKWGGNFLWNNKEYPLYPGEFLIFNPRVEHENSPIKCNKKRMAIDFAVDPI